jgi:hypothetical protein
MDDLTRPSTEFKKKSISQATRLAPAGGHWKIVLSIILLAVVAALAYLLLSGRIFGSGRFSENNWQAVFLSTGEVYFGHVLNEKSDPVLLRDIFYLQSKQSLQQAQAGEIAASANQNELSLVKLGNELHGPIDEMRINRSHILYMETLKTESLVVKSIEQYVEDSR